ncbi:hypothetical protein KQI84_01980 [bacterium]|nr:hypothetical protein [bacterium]
MRFFALILTTLLISTAAAQSVPSLVNYQGRLVDSNGNPLEGMKMLEFNIYGSETGSDLLWGPQTFDNVPLISGEFNVILSQDTDGDDVTDGFSTSSAFLGIKVGDAGGTVGAEFLPRQQFLAVPYAFHSLDSESANSGDLLARIEALENAVFPVGSSFWVKYIDLLQNGSCGGVAIDSQGNVILSGRRGAGSVDFGGGVLEADQTAPFLAKFAPDGNHLWSMHFPIVGEYAGYFDGVDVDSADNVIVTGYVPDGVDLGGGALSAGLVVAKFDSNGVFQWGNTYASGGGTIVAIAPDDSIVVSGSFSDSMGIGADFYSTNGKSDIIFAKFTSAGAPVWARHFGSAQDDEITGMDIDSNGDIVVSGQYESSMNIGAISLSHHGIVSNGYYYRLFFSLFDSNGVPQWANGYAPSTARFTKSDWSGGVGFDTAGNFWTAAHFVGGRDFGNGTLGTDNTDQYGFLQFDHSGNAIEEQIWAAFKRETNYLTMNGDDPIAGLVLSINSPIDFGGGPIDSGLVYIGMEETTTGLAHRWSRNFGGLTGNTGLPGDMDCRDGKLAVARRFSGTVDLGTGPVTDQSSGTIYLTLMKP